MMSCTVYSIWGFVCSVCCPLQQIISVIRDDKEGVWPGLVHYKSCAANPGGQGWIRGSAARTEEGGLGTRGPQEVTQRNEWKCCKTVYCLWFPNPVRQMIGQQSSTEQRRPTPATKLSWICNYIDHVAANLRYAQAVRGVAFHMFA